MLLTQSSSFLFSDGIPMIHRNGGERGEPLTLPVGGNGRLYGLATVGEYCPRSKKHF